ncbi:MAG: hypothetical protein MAG471_01884 [Acidimicrobiaceae bacterium]|nr:hypothetical protein [Acidimicrobiaceae bacterium]
MQRKRRHTDVLSDTAGLEVGEVGIVGSLPELHGDRHVTGRTYRSPHDRPEQARLQRKGGTAALAGDLWHRTAEVEVDVVDPVLVHQQAYGAAHALGLGSVELDAAGRLVRLEPAVADGLGIAVNEATCGDHLAHEQAGTHFPAERPEGGVGDAGHRGQHDRWPHLHGTDPGCRELARSRRCHTDVHLAAQPHGAKRTAGGAVGVQAARRKPWWAVELSGVLPSLAPTR